MKSICWIRTGHDRRGHDSGLWGQLEWLMQMREYRNIMEELHTLVSCRRQPRYLLAGENAPPGDMSQL